MEENDKAQPNLDSAAFTKTISKEEAAGHEIDFFYLTGVFYRYWKFIVSFTFIVAIASVIYVLMATKIYQSSVSLYPMNKEDDGPLKQLALSLGISNKTSGFYIVDVINSRRVAKEVIHEKYCLDPEKKDSVTLLQFWELDKLEMSENRIFEQAVRTLRASMEVKEDKETSLVSLSVQTENKYLSKAIADKYCSTIVNYLNNETKNSIKESIKFAEVRLDSVKRELIKAEAGLLVFLNSNIRTSSPNLSMELKRKYKEVELLQGVDILLEKQIELLKVEEVKDKTIINILDEAEVYDKPIKPQKRRIVIVNTFMSFLLSFVIVVMKEKAVKYNVYERLITELKYKKK